MREPTKALKVPLTVDKNLVKAGQAMGLAVAATLARAAKLLATSDVASGSKKTGFFPIPSMPTHATPLGAGQVIAGVPRAEPIRRSA